MRIWFVALISISIIVLSLNCRNTTKIEGNFDIVVHQEYSLDTYYGKIPDIMANASRGIGLYPLDGVMPPLETNRPQNVEFRVQDGEIFRAFLTLTNGRDTERTILVTALLDYQQTDCIIDNKNGLLHEITIPPATQLFLTIGLKLEKHGAHDLIVVYFDDPYNKTLNEDYRMDLFGRSLGFRAVIIFGENEKPILSDSMVVTGQPVPGDVTFTHPLYFASLRNDTSEHPSHRQLYVAQSKPSAIYSFQIVLNNVEKVDSVTYMLVAFLNYCQVPIQNHSTLLAKLNPQNEAIVNMSLKMPKNTGTNLFQMIRVYDPYKSVLDKEVFTAIVFSSPRIAIITEN